MSNSGKDFEIDDDLVSRLRAYPAKEIFFVGEAEEVSLMREAADEIEKLRNRENEK